jgi:hypothetical protein
MDEEGCIATCKGWRDAGAVGINRRLLSSVLAGINWWLLLGSTVGSCWDRPSIFAGIDRKLQGELC